MYKTEKSFDVIQGKVPYFHKGKMGDITTIALIDGTSVDDFPNKEDGYLVKNTVCDNNAIGVFDTENWSLNVTNIQKSHTTCTVYFQSAFEKLIEIIHSNAKDYDELLTNAEDMDHIVSSQEAMQLLATSSVLKNGFKENAHYTEEVAKKLLNSTVISEDEKYNAGLPCYIYWNQYGTFSNFTGGFTYGGWSYRGSSTLKEDIGALYSTYNSSKVFQMFASWSTSYVSAFSKNKINTNQYQKLEIDGTTYTNYSNVTGTLYYGFDDNQGANTTFKISNNLIFTNAPLRQSFILDINELDDESYLKIYLKHNGEQGTMTVCLYIYSIALY